MQGVVHHVVQHVEREAAGDDAIGDVVGEEGVSEFGEGGLEGGEERRGHDEAHAVHLNEGSGEYGETKKEEKRGRTGM
jgi:hypothetical protein